MLVSVEKICTTDNSATKTFGEFCNSCNVSLRDAIWFSKTPPLLYSVNASLIVSQIYAAAAFVWSSTGCLPDHQLQSLHSITLRRAHGYPIILDFFWTYCSIRSAKATIDRIQSANQSIVLSIQTATVIYYLLSDVWVSENADCKDCFSFQTF